MRLEAQFEAQSIQHIEGRAKSLVKMYGACLSQIQDL